MTIVIIVNIATVYLHESCCVMDRKKSRTGLKNKATSTLQPLAVTIRNCRRYISGTVQRSSVPPRRAGLRSSCGSDFIACPESATRTCFLVLRTTSAQQSPSVRLTETLRQRQRSWKRFLSDHCSELCIVVQVVVVCVCVCLRDCVCPNSNIWSKWSLTYIFGTPFTLTCTPCSKKRETPNSWP